MPTSAILMTVFGLTCLLFACVAHEVTARSFRTSLQSRLLAHHAAAAQQVSDSLNRERSFVQTILRIGDLEDAIGAVILNSSSSSGDSTAAPTGMTPAVATLAKISAARSAGGFFATDRSGKIVLASPGLELAERIPSCYHRDFEIAFQKEGCYLVPPHACPLDLFALSSDAIPGTVALICVAIQRDEKIIGALAWLTPVNGCNGLRQTAILDTWKGGSRLVDAMARTLPASGSNPILAAPLNDSQAFPESEIARFIRLSPTPEKETTGCTLRPYTNHLGTRVIGAWEWLPQEGVGIISEFESQTSLSPMRKALALIWLVFGTPAVLSLAWVATRKFFGAPSSHREECFGSYRVTRAIRDGARSAVYEAEHSVTGGHAAIKTLSVDAGELARERFQQEFRLASQLRHPNVIRILDGGHSSSGRLYYAMELVQGDTLEQLVARQGPLPDRHVLPILEQLCSCLAYLHDLRRVHGDLTPANLMLTNDACLQHEVVKLVDFGLAREFGKQATADTISGTPGYMAPEVAQGNHTCDARNDLYSVGSVGYYLLSGALPFAGKTPVEICWQQIHEQPLALGERIHSSASSQLISVLMRCLDPNIERRPASANELQNELRAIAPASPGNSP